MKKGAGFFTISMKIDLFFSVHFHSSNGKIRGGGGGGCYAVVRVRLLC